MIITKTVQINVTSELLWEVLTGEEHIKQWMSSLISDEPVEPGPTKVGYLSKMKIKEGSNIVEYDSEITTYEPTKHLGMMLKGGNLGKGPMSIDYRLEAEETGTILNYEARWEPRGFALKLMSPIITMMSRKNAEEELKQIKDYAEGLSQ